MDYNKTLNLPETEYPMKRKPSGKGAGNARKLGQ